MASSITQSGSVISGNIPMMVVVKSDPGYDGNPGHAGAGRSWTLQQLLDGGATFTSRTIVNSGGSWPSVVAGPGGKTAFVVYTGGTRVLATVQVF